MLVTTCKGSMCLEVDRMKPWTVNPSVVGSRIGGRLTVNHNSQGPCGALTSNYGRWHSLDH
jgi:hypothetical protein